MKNKLFSEKYFISGILYSLQDNVLIINYNKFYDYLKDLYYSINRSIYVIILNYSMKNKMKK